MARCWCSKHCEEYFFKKEVISHENIWIEFDTSAEVSNSRHMKANNLWDNGVFSSIILSQRRRPKIELKFLQVCYFMHEIHQVGRLVFDNCQWCPVPLMNNVLLPTDHVDICRSNVGSKFTIRFIMSQDNPISSLRAQSTNNQQNTWILFVVF